MVGAGQFSLPALNAALFVVDIEEDQDVRIHELKIRYVALYGKSSARIVSGRAVVCPNGRRKDQQSKNEKNGSIAFHAGLGEIT